MKRYKLISAISLLTLTICCLAFGIYAAIDTNFKIAGTISFNAVGIKTDVTITISGTANGEIVKRATTDPRSGRSFFSNGESGVVDGVLDISSKSQTLMLSETALEFNETDLSNLNDDGTLKEGITITIKVQNYSKFNIQASAKLSKIDGFIVNDKITDVSLYSNVLQQESGATQSEDLSFEIFPVSSELPAKGKLNIEIDIFPYNNAIPSYYTGYLSNQLVKIKEKQNLSGINSTTFIMITDNHNSSVGSTTYKVLNYLQQQLGCVLVDGGDNTNSYNYESITNELKSVKDEYKNFDGPVLRMRGNHDGCYSYDENGNLRTNSSGESQYYAYKLPNSEINDLLYSNLPSTAVIHSSGAYYYDELNTKTRYLVLNTVDQPDDINDDESNLSGLTNVQTIRQSQIDFLIAALQGLSNYGTEESNWKTIITTHVPSMSFYSDNFKTYDIVNGILGAYKNHSTYSGTYGSNLFKSAQSETIISSLFQTVGNKPVKNYRINSSGAKTAVSSEYNYIMSPLIPCTHNQIVRWSNINTDFVYNGQNYNRIYFFDKDGNYLQQQQSIKVGESAGVTKSATGVYSYQCAKSSNFSNVWSDIAYISIGGTVTDEGSPIITVDEELDWRALYVNVDFTNSKSSLVGMFTGHVHSDNAYSGLPFQIITTRTNNNNPSQDRATDFDLYENRAVGTIYEVSFDVVTIDPTNKKIYITKIGAGKDRELSY